MFPLGYTPVSPAQALANLPRPVPTNEQREASEMIEDHPRNTADQALASRQARLIDDGENINTEAPIELSADPWANCITGPCHHDLVRTITIEELHGLSDGPHEAPKIEIKGPWGATMLHGTNLEEDNG